MIPSQALPAPKERRASLIQRFGPFIRALYRCVAEPWLRRAAIKELRRLRARELRDIGIEPYEIDDVIDDMLAKRR